MTKLLAYKNILPFLAHSVKLCTLITSLDNEG